ncbi:hypothetical protein Tco_0924449 [Tanacetum coccineum]|uniref:Retrotransposon protein, putative, Ty1-copia subclass n=1 Tax=Tanacetum coccineum TaxID=301880 RepID=A0ABQ5D596_9ASTR
MSVYEIGEHSANMLESILEYKLNKAVADNGSDGGKPNESPNAITNHKHHSLLLQLRDDNQRYTDAGYLTDADDIKSSGYVFVLNGGDVDWKSTKQSIFATSSTDDEYIVAFDASKEDVWIRKFISGLGVLPTIEEPINTYYNNTGAIANREISCSSLKVQVPISQQKSLSRETINIDVKIEKG